MAKPLVTYHNDMNKVNLGNFLVKELDLFFSLCFKLKESGGNEIRISFTDIQKLIGEVRSIERFKQNLENLNKKLSQLNYQIEISPNVFERFVLFINLTSNYNDNTLTIKVNEKFNYILNNLIGNFTKFDLMEFVSLKSSYSKNMFKIIKQWEWLPVKEKDFPIEEFREMLKVPATYRMSIIDIKVLRPIEEELLKYYKTLKIEKIKTGKKVTSIKFSWIKKKEDIEVLETNFIEISKELNDTIQETRSNKYISPFLREENISILLNIYDEKQLIRGLKYSRKNIKLEFKKLTYLINSIRDGNKKQEIVFKVQENFTLFPTDSPVDSSEKKKIKITKEEYEKMYIEHLDENKMKNNKMNRGYFDLSNKNYEII